MRKENKEEKDMAIEFVKEIQKQFTMPIIENIDKFLDKQGYEEPAKSNFRKTLMITIANSIFMLSGASKKELKQSYRGFIADYDEIK
ncbi:MAG: hypothetical protein EOL97_13545 [Spirochaetia bacterium]|nr:hypothetical protein [Spirochaetia bacterium]